MLEQKREIVVCPQCKGIGKVAKLNTDGSYYISRGEPVLELCPSCDGERVVLKQETIEYFRMSPQIIQEETEKKGMFKKWRK